MAKKYKILDLFCKAGGAAKGYYEAGFEVLGVNIVPQPNYPYDRKAVNRLFKEQLKEAICLRD